LPGGSPPKVPASPPSRARRLRLLVELDRPVRDLAGAEPVEGWQPADIPAQLAPFGVV